MSFYPIYVPKKYSKAFYILEELARKRKITVSELICQIIEEYVERNAEGEPSNV